MNMKKTIGICATFLAALLCALPQSAQATGKIRAVDAYDPNGNHAFPNAGSALTVGDKIRIRFRMVNIHWDQTAAVDSTYENPWEFVYTGSLTGITSVDQALALMANKPRLGLWVSGQVREAECVNWPLGEASDWLKDEGMEGKRHYTDLIFEYTVQPGDIALPLQLARWDGKGPASAGAGVDLTSGGEKIYLKCNGEETLWKMVDKQTHSVTNDFAWGPSNLESDPDFNGDVKPIMLWRNFGQPAENTDLDLSQAGVYIQAIDFDSTYFDEGAGVWRSIAQGSTTADPGVPTLAIKDGASGPMTLYLWTTNDVAEVVKGGQVEEVREYDFGGGVMHKVGKINIKKDDTSVPFYVKATGSVGATAEVFLSAMPTNIYYESGDVITNFISRTVQVGEPLPPSIAVTVDGTASRTVTANADFRTAQVAVNVKLSEAYTADFDVPIKVSLKSNTLALDPTNYVALSESSVNDNTAWDTVLHVSKNSTTATASLWMYANRGSVDTEVGLSFEVDTNNTSWVSSSAKSFFTGKFTGATVVINRSTPEITEELTYVTADANADQEITINVADAYGELHEPCKYTVYWSNSGNDSAAYYTKSENVAATAGGNLTFNVKYPQKGEFDSLYYVVNQDGKASTKHTAKVHVNAAKVVDTVLYSPSGRFAENDFEEQPVVTLTFGEGFRMPDDSDWGYVFFVPKTESASNDVICAQMDGGTRGDYCDWKKGFPVFRDQTEVGPINMYLLDGDTNGGKSMSGTTMEYDIIVRSAKDFDSGTLVSSWSSKGFSFNVTNVAPNVTAVTMGSETLYENGGTLGPISIGVTKALSAETDEPSGIDFYFDDPNYTDTKKAFETRWDIKLGSYTYTTNIFGPPTEPFDYRFMQAGTYTIEVQMRDKDSFDRSRQKTKYGPKFTFTVNVDAKPAVSLSPHFGTTAFTENSGSTGENALSRIDVNLSTLPSEQIAVQLTIERAGTDNGNYPLPELSTTTLSFGGESPNTTNAYFSLRNLDGTDRTLDPGFVIRAAVTNTTVNGDNVQWKDVYRSTELPITIANLAPEVTRPPSNTVTRAINEPFTINYTFKDFGSYDMYNNGVKAETLYWTITGESSVEETVIPNANTYRGTFTTKFTSAGTKTVQLQVVDKDGGESEVATWYYRVDAAKQFVVTPCGPGRSGGGDAAVKWTGQRNVGVGRVWADGVIKPFSDFAHIYTYAPSIASATAYAHGYSAGDVDDGSLKPGTDYSVSQNGTYVSTPVSGSGYRASGAKDSFFYAWLQSTSSGAGGSMATTLLKLDPAYEAGSNAKQRVDLPPEEKDATYYPDTILDAVFSREYLATDNLGDINGDQIPDYYAVMPIWDGGKRLFEVGAGASDDGGDVSFNGFKYNDDADYLPSRSFEGGLPNTATGWTTLSAPFTAYWEIRGFHEGLNHRTGHDGMNLNVRGDWVSVPHFSEAETNAVAYWNARRGGSTTPDLVTWAEFKAAATNEATYAADYEAWSNKFHTAVMDPNSWIPENRTDPTLYDTDDDGFPDGYEYYFWYRAAVGSVDADGKWTQMKGSRFTLNNIAVGEEISPAEIMDAFDPTVKARGNEDDIRQRDTDNDGLTDMEEFYMGTNPVHWDSDGDGMSDLWEIMRGMNPLKRPSSPEMNVDGDFMASYTTEKTYGILTMTNGVVFALSQNGANIQTFNKELFEGGTNVPASAVFGLEGESNVSNVMSIAVFRYGDDSSLCVPKALGDRARLVKPLDLEMANLADMVVAKFEINQPLLLVHNQVYNQFGFDPRTGWCNANGYVGARWHAPQPVTIGDSGLAVNTVAYNCVDEYRVLKYRYETGLRAASDDIAKIQAKELPLSDVFMKGTTNPNIPFTEANFIVYDAGGEFPAYTSTNYGADTDEDGVPDGWELYVGSNPNDDSNADTADRDGDSLNLVLEYAGTDSCNAYESAANANGVATIYQNHPGNSKGWFNKFFPTDPYDSDTDGDGIDDKTEGGTWIAAFRFWQAEIQENKLAGERASLVHDFTFIYGTPSDDGRVCIRGGGLNPCAIDTDYDLLPDAWEHDFAGVVFKDGAPGKGDTTYGTTVRGLLSGTVTIINRNDNVISNGVAQATSNAYITAGMDGTFGPASGGGDAVSRPDVIDPFTGTNRNYDFDNDGLQNFQEYLVQTLRHLRYDDTETPLMGSYLPDGVAGTRKYVGFLPMQVWDGAEFYKTARAAGFSGLSAHQGEGFRYDQLGYFTRPPREWDPMALRESPCNNYDENGFRILMRPNGLSSQATADSETRWSDVAARAGVFVSTDPRLWDSDADGMDDYYELFHGLNPLLGGYDVIAEAYYCEAKDGKLFSARCNAWTGWEEKDLEYDAMKYPWAMGTAEADADGDGLRNTDEALLVNMPNPKNYHTDPTPLWMTDSSSKISVTSQYYGRDPYMTANPAAAPDLSSYPWFEVLDGTTPGAVGDYIFSFEENEGYDTDHDWIPDEQELTHAVTRSSDPLDATDPDRRQAMYFPGTNSVVASYSSNLHRRLGENYAMLRTFTVEAWVRPDNTNDQTILTRVCDYPSSTLLNGKHQVRANFRIAMKGGLVYGQYDSDDAVPSGNPKGFGTTTVTGIALETNKWSHVALSFDGSSLILYVDGREASRAYSNLIPANGLVVTLQSVTPAGANYGGDPDSNASGYTKCPSAFFVGADAAELGALTVGADSAWTNYCAYYQGWVDEVRVWDGARTAEQIADNYKKRYSLADVSDLREQVYREWLQGATHNPNDGHGDLPAELLLHYSFQQLPSEVSTNTVATMPSGFSDKVRDNVRWNGHPVDISCGWWSAVPIASTIYKNRAIVPWLRNTCSVLPALEGTTPDSVYWGELLGGVTFPTEVNVSKFVFPNTANPYPYWNYMAESFNRSWQLGMLLSAQSGLEPTARDVLNRFQFDNRTYFVGGSDLLPLGGAYAKRCPDFWDGNGATDAWTATLNDRDNDGLPDWWEQLYMPGNTASLTATTEIDYVLPSERPSGTPVRITAREAYLFDLASGLLPDGTYDPAYESLNTDANHDGIPDWWQKSYGVYDVVPEVDTDNDALSNFAEYLIGECFARYGFPRVRPSLMYSLRAVVPDYFLRVGKLYLGEMFTDHDFMEDLWEDRYDATKISRAYYDPWRDADGDGWSNFAECRAGTDPSIGNSLGLDGVLCRNYPVPTIHATVVMEQGLGTLDGTIVVQAYSDASKKTGMPDAIWTISTGESSSDSNDQTEKSAYLGANPNREVTLTLAPGSISPGSVSLDFIDPTWATYESGRLTYGGLKDAKWLEGWVEDRPTADLATGVLVTTEQSGNIREVGSINYNSGMARIDFTQLTNSVRIYESAASDRTDINTPHTLIHLQNSYVRAKWNATIAGGNTWMTLHLTESDETTSEGSDLGHVREGVNTFVVFVADKDGKWKPGAPYGVAKDVDVGWSDAAFTVELTRTTPIMARYDLASALGSDSGGSSGGGSGGSDSSDPTDRGSVNAARGYAPNMIEEVTAELPSNISLTRIRVVRNYINYKTTKNDVVLDRCFDLSVHPLLTEADLFADGKLDLDWGTLNKAFNNNALPNATLTNATYRVVVGDGDIGKAGFYGDSLSAFFSNQFEQKTKQTPTVPDPTLPEIVYASSPTFRWSHTNTIDKAYPAFQLRIYEDAAKTKIVFDSGVQRAPVRDSNGMYEWKAPVYAGMVTSSNKVFTTTNNYYWAVSMLDAKFTTFSADEKATLFRLGVSGNLFDGKGYGSIAVRVKYFGPLVDSLSSVPTTRKNLVRVQAFTSPDFSGLPVAETYVSDIATIASETNTAQNAIIRGVSPDRRYYVRAYIDTDADGVKSDWESWGYACSVGDLAAKSIWTPKPVTVSYDDVESTVTVFIEDADTDNDAFPDAWEMNKNGNLTAQGPISGNTFFAAVNTNLVSVLSAYERVAASSLDNSRLADSLRGFRLMSRAPIAAAELLGAEESELPEETTSVWIKAFSLEEGLELEVKSSVAAGTSDAIIFNAQATVQLSLVCATSPDFSDAVEVPIKSITIYADDTNDDAVVTAEELAEARAKAPEARFFKAIIKK